MNKFVAILRGINVGGHRKILMADLKTILTKVGFKNVSTYIQSGNVTFESESSAKENETTIYKAIHKQYGYEVPVIIRNQKQLEQLIQNNPFLEEAGEEIEKLYVVFFDKKPMKEKIAAFNNLTFGEDKFFITDRHAFLKYKTKASHSKLTHAVFESKLKVTCSARNWKTCLKLREMVG